MTAATASAGERGPICSLSSIVKSFDGRVENFELENLHWDFAMDLLDALPAVPRRDPLVAEWYRAIGAYLVSERRFADALQHFDRARSVVPDDPKVLFGEACLQETLGAPRVQDYVRVTTLPNGMAFSEISAAPTHWRRAEGLPGPNAQRIHSAREDRHAAPPEGVSGKVACDMRLLGCEVAGKTSRNQ